MYEWFHCFWNHMCRRDVCASFEIANTKFFRYCKRLICKIESVLTLPKMTPRENKQTKKCVDSRGEKTKTAACVCFMGNLLEWEFFIFNGCRLHNTDLGCLAKADLIRCWFYNSIHFLRCTSNAEGESDGSRKERRQKAMGNKNWLWLRFLLGSTAEQPSEKSLCNRIIMCQTRDE